MKYYIISGEASGDLHGSMLINSLQKEDNHAIVRAWGGDLMQTAGANLVRHYKEMAYMGIGQVLRHLPSILGNFKFCHRDILEFAPDALILIDYSGFNLRVAEWAKKQGLTVFYYISPQVWATREGRVEKIKKNVDKMFVILPFEKDFYKKHDYDVEFIGHPLLDVVDNYEVDKDFKSKFNLTDKPIIALLPGSRKQEIKSMLKIMLSVVDDFAEYQFVIAGAPSMDAAFYDSFIQGKKNVHFIPNQTYNLLANSHAALVTSGTATLETALFGVPQIVCYKTGTVLYNIVKRIIKVPFISIVNLIMGLKIVQELIQHDLNHEKLKSELRFIIEGAPRQEILANYSLLREKLGQNGASDRAARSILLFLSK